MTLDTNHPDDRDEWYAARATSIDDRPTAADETPDLAWARTLGPDPWFDVHTCQKCGEVTDYLPEVCRCGLRNWGVAS